MLGQARNRDPTYNRDHCRRRDSIPENSLHFALCSRESSSSAISPFEFLSWAGIQTVSQALSGHP